MMVRVFAANYRDVGDCWFELRRLGRKLLERRDALRKRFEAGVEPTPQGIWFQTSSVWFYRLPYRHPSQLRWPTC